MATDHTATNVNGPWPGPTHSDNTPIKWDGVHSHLDGILYEISRWQIRTGKHRSVTENRLVLYRGRRYVSSVQTIKFLKGLSADEEKAHGVLNPCPTVIATRIREFNDYMTATGGSAFAPYDESALPKDVSEDYTVNADIVNQDDNSFLDVLSHVIFGADDASWLSDKASGSGTALLILLADLASKVDDAEKALVQAQYEAIKLRGVKGQLSTTSLTSHIDYTSTS